jgi:hypothetical protein
MNLITSARDLFYEKKLDKNYKNIEKILERRLFDYTKAKKLFLEYNIIVNNIKEDTTLNNSERKLWYLILKDYYQPTYNRLKTKINSILLQ